MTNRTIGAAKFKAECLALLDEVKNTGDSLTVTKRGKVVAVVSPPPKERVSLIGSLATTGYRFDDPFSPAIDPDEWNANR